MKLYISKWRFCNCQTVESMAKTNEVSSSISCLRAIEANRQCECDQSIVLCGCLCPSNGEIVVFDLGRAQNFR